MLVLVFCDLAKSRSEEAREARKRERERVREQLRAKKVSIVVVFIV
jgi:hypothetical protein